MAELQKKGASLPLIIIAFLIVYIVWGSTYFFIAQALKGLPPFLIGAIRFIFAGSVLLGWCKLNGYAVFNKRNIRNAAIGGFLMLLIGNGTVIWVEQFMSSGLVAIIVSSAAIWFVILDKPKWKENFGNKFTVAGLIVGFIGVVLLFAEQLMGSISEAEHKNLFIGVLLLILGPVGWAAGSLFSKYNNIDSIPVAVTTAWQMFVAGILFTFCSWAAGEIKHFEPETVSASAWWAVAYLSVFGSVVAFSAYVWLLQVLPATQVSTYAYVNPVVAVLLSVFIADEAISWLQVVGLCIILGSVLLINLSKYRRKKV